MTQDSTYNGWTNYATWRVNLEMADDYIESLRAGLENGYADKFDGPAAFADYLQEAIEELIRDSADDYHEEKLATQYAMAFLGQVNWWEIAANAIEDNPHFVRSEDDEEDETDEDQGE